MASSGCSQPPCGNGRRPSTEVRGTGVPVQRRRHRLRTIRVRPLRPQRMLQQHCNHLMTAVGGGRRRAVHWRSRGRRCSDMTTAWRDHLAGSLGRFLAGSTDRPATRATRTGLAGNLPPVPMVSRRPHPRPDKPMAPRTGERRATGRRTVGDRRRHAWPCEDPPRAGRAPPGPTVTQCAAANASCVQLSTGRRTRRGAPWPRRRSGSFPSCGQLCRRRVTGGGDHEPSSAAGFGA